MNINTNRNGHTTSITIGSELDHLQGVSRLADQIIETTVKPELRSAHYEQVLAGELHEVLSGDIDHIEIPGHHTIGGIPVTIEAE